MNSRVAENDDGGEGRGEGAMPEHPPTILSPAGRAARLHWWHDALKAASDLRGVELTAHRQRRRLVNSWVGRGSRKPPFPESCSPVHFDLSQTRLPVFHHHTSTPPSPFIPPP